MKKITLDNIEYEIVKNYKDAFNQQEISEKFTDYFYNFDYILGDYSYDKLRLKGFCIRKNKEFKTINDYDYIDKYINNYCSYECRYFILKKCDKNS